MKRVFVLGVLALGGCVYPPPPYPYYMSPYYLPPLGRNTYVPPPTYTPQQGEGLGAPQEYPPQQAIPQGYPPSQGYPPLGPTGQQPPWDPNTPPINLNPPPIQQTPLPPPTGSMPQPPNPALEVPDVK